MENTNRDTAQGTAPQNDWQDAEINMPLDATSNAQDTELHTAASRYGANADSGKNMYASGNNDDPDDDEDEDEDEEEGDWGHVDPAEGNSPFPDNNDPSGPGSAV
jgi:hypothetical protein